MKTKILLASLFFLAPLSTFASMTFDPASPQVGLIPTTPTCSIGSAVALYAPDGSFVMGIGCDGSTLVPQDPYSFGTYVVVEATGGTYLGSLDSVQYSEEFVSSTTYTWLSGGGSSDSAFTTQLGNATSTFQATTGFDIAGVVAWSGDNLIKLFIGSGLAVLLALRGWIVALVIIGSIVYFAYRAFRFFRH